MKFAFFSLLSLIIAQSVAQANPAYIICGNDQDPKNPKLMTLTSDATGSRWPVSAKPGILSVNGKQYTITQVKGKGGDKRIEITATQGSEAVVATYVEDQDGWTEAVGHVELTGSAGSRTISPCSESGGALF